MDKIRIAIIDDEKLIREGLEIILSTYEDIEVVALGENGYEALEICKNQDIDLVLIDIRMPKCDGVEGTKIIKKEFPYIKVLILTTFQDTDYIKDALSNGACGYLLKDSSYDLIYQAIKTSLGGNIVIHPDVAKDMLNNTSEDIDLEAIIDKYSLDKREIEIIRLIADGLTNKEIGEDLFLSEGTSELPPLIEVDGFLVNIPNGISLPRL